MSTEMVTAFTTGLTSIKTDAVALITVALPIGLAIAGLFIAIKLGMKFFKKVGA